MSIVTPCGNPTEEANCSCCLDKYECQLLREAICSGCKREYGPCLPEFKRKMAESGHCRGRELRE